MNEQKQKYASPCIEMCELESEYFIAASGPEPPQVDFGNVGTSNGWNIQKGGGNTSEDI